MSHTVKRNKFAVVVYALLCLLFLVVGIAVGAGMSDKVAFIIHNRSGIFRYLTGDRGIFAFFFFDLLLSVIYCLFAASMFFFKALAYLSVAPCIYRSYVLGTNTCIIIAVYSVSALPMLFVLFIPMCLAEILILCILSFGCFGFASLNRYGMPCKYDIKMYYKNIIRYLVAVAVCAIIKAVTLVLFGSALIGVI